MPIYLDYDDIDGDVTEPGHVNWIELYTVSFGPNPRVSFNGTGPEPTFKIDHVVVTKGSDRASQPLIRESLSGSPVDAVIDFTRGDGHVHLTLELTDTLVSGWQLSGPSEQPQETMTLNFSRFRFVRS